ncbi:hypothetical protein K502DRAFT_347121 [Neoconidiobolus thromboides FSU 785]|nr:hypothetical protein K502DRAFT_347121 [Neoconidiobolus thromboides FSU 785]
MSLAEVENTFKRILTRKGVKGVLIVTREEGLVIKSSLEEELGKKYAKVIKNLIKVAQESIVEIEEQDFLKFLRIRTDKHEIMVSPAAEYILVVVQDPSELHGQ